MDRRSSPYSSVGGSSESPYSNRRNTVGATRPGAPHPRQHMQFDADPTLDQMRQQFFDRDNRDMFFDQPGMRWPGGADDDDFFSRPPRGFDGFPSPFQSRFNDRFGQPFPGEGGQRHPQRSGETPPPTHHHPHPQHAQQPSPRPPQEHYSHPSESIPIRVVHERPMGNKKHPVGSPRNTTQLPARGSSPQPASPRLERSASEPPKAFTQRLFSGQNVPRAGATIPEGGPAPVPPPSQHQQPAQRQPGSTLQVPDASSDPQNNLGLSTSASAPSVPSSTPKPSQPGAAPVPPPRRPTPTKGHYQQHPNDQEQEEDLTQHQIRHIPIFVEGRKDPVYSSRVNRGDVDPQQQASGKKPSDFYPPGVTKVKPPQRHQTAQPPQAQHARPSDLNVSKKLDPNAEPTSPLSPPTGPIAMGCSASHLEPTSPMPVKEGEVIALPCSPDFYNLEKNKEEEKEAAAQREPSMQPNEAEEENPSRKASKEETTDGKAEKKPTQEDLVEAQIEKVKAAVAELSERIANFKGDKKDKEYLYLDEMLTRHLLSLDSVETHGNEKLRTLRKESIRSINRCLSMLDNKTQQPQQNGDAEENNVVLEKLVEASKQMDVAAGEKAKKVDSMEVSDK